MVPVPRPLPEEHALADMRALVERHRSSAKVSPAEAERAVALEFGFATWRQLTTYLTHPGEFADLLQLACLSYFQTDRSTNQERARAMLDADPTLGTRDIWSAACVGDVAAVQRFLEANPALVNQRGGHFDWEPLLYACYSRLDVPGNSTLAVAGLLIERGADPNSHYMWGGQYRFSALAGAFGEGEMGPVNQPPHPQCTALAGLLLDAGADPNDGQALYNTMFTPGSDCLAMLLDHGLGPEHLNNWRWAQDGEYVENPERTLDYQLNWAVRNHHVERAKILIDHGANPSGRTPEGRTLYEAARFAGHPDLAALLAEHGAPVTEVDAATRLVGACMGGDAATAREVLNAEPDLVRQVQQAQPDLVVDAAASNRLEAVRVMADMGFGLDRQGAVAPLHQAAFQGHAEMVELLIARGANPGARDGYHAATPMQWADTGGHPEVVTILAGTASSIFDAIVADDPDRLAALLDANPDLLETTIRPERTDTEPHPTDWQTPLAFAVLRGRTAMVRLLLGRGARTDVADSDGNTLREIAHKSATEEIIGLLP